MPKYEVSRSYLVTAVTTIEADSEQHAEEIALYDGDVYWKEYDGEYLPDITVEQVDDV